MRYGVTLDTSGSIDDVIEEARWAAEGGLASVWSSQIFGYDTLTVLAVVGREVPDIELMTPVVPTYPLLVDTVPGPYCSTLVVPAVPGWETEPTRTCRRAHHLVRTAD